MPFEEKSKFEKLKIVGLNKDPFFIISEMLFLQLYLKIPIRMLYF